MASYLITGAGRGLGFELVKQLLLLPQADASLILAATRSSPSPALQELIDSSNGRVAHISVTITNKSSISAAIPEVEKKLNGKGLDVLINNAGVMPFTSGGIAAMSDLREVFDINVQAVQDVTTAFLPLLKKGGLKKVVNM
jgi:NAD(P)-dependent dehydrogenase (short-subunit alcohol dehydrogenase family)